MILDFWNAYLGEGYRRLTYGMLDTKLQAAQAAR